MKDSEDVQRLLRLKRYETPGEEYFKQFAEDLKERQRGELLQSSSRSLLAERFTMWMDEFSPNRWAFPATATACAAALSIGSFVFLQPSASENESSSIAETSAGGASLPDFPLSSDEVIQLSIPKVSPRIPDGPFDRGENVLTAKAGIGFREL
ncbi:MAG: hypothetical protein P1U68_13720 [Verrucomicrobiales bacterium]|nr:hypothetical protein [Verrucomicrobiales bacterium]